MDVTFVERIDLSRVDQRHAGNKRKAHTTTSHRVAVKLTSKQRLASRVYNLSLDVAALRQQLQELELHKSLLQTRLKYTKNGFEESAVGSTVEYWKVFRRGFQATDSTQPAFLQSILDDSLQLGRKELLQQWALFAEYFAIRRYEMHSVRVATMDEVTGCCITRSEGEFCGSFTMQGLEMVFPNVLRDPQLTRRLLGREMKTPIAFVLYYDAESKWVRHDTETNFLQALGDALGGDIIQAAVIMQEVESTIRIDGEESKRRAESHSHTTRGKRPWYMAHNHECAREEEQATRRLKREYNHEDDHQATLVHL